MLPRLPSKEIKKLYKDLLNQYNNLLPTTYKTQMPLCLLSKRPCKVHSVTSNHSLAQCSNNTKKTKKPSSMSLIPMQENSSLNGLLTHRELLKDILETWLPSIRNSLEKLKDYKLQCNNNSKLSKVIQREPWLLCNQDGPLLIKNSSLILLVLLKVSLVKLKNYCKVTKLTQQELSNNWKDNTSQWCHLLNHKCTSQSKHSSVTHKEHSNKWKLLCNNSCNPPQATQQEPLTTYSQPVKVDQRPQPPLDDQW